MNKKLINELAVYLYYGFPLLQKQGTVKNVEEFIERNIEKVIYIREGIELVGVAVYMLLEDDTISKVLYDCDYLKKLENFRKAEKENGDNLHFFTLRANGIRIILKGLKNIMEVKNPKTISWIKPNEKDITLIRRR